MKSNYCFHFLGALMSMIVTISFGDNPRVYDYFAIQDPCGDHNRVIAAGQGIYSRYGFIRADTDNCYDQNKECRIHLNASSGYQITMRFQYIAIDCNDGVLEIEGETDADSYCAFYTPSYSMYSSMNWLKYRFLTYSVSYCQSGFSFYYTTYHTGECSDDEFRCANGRCIPEELKCDIYDNCGDWSDERSGTCGLTTGAIAAISVTCVLVGLSCIVFLAYCLYDKKHRRQHISTTRRGSTDRCEVATATTVPVGPPTYADSPPNYTYMNAVYSGVYEDPDSDPYKAPPSYQAITINNSYPN